MSSSVLVRLAGLLALAALALPAAAQAASVNVAISPDPLEDRPITLTATTDTTTDGDGDPARVYAKWRVDDGNPCGPTYGSDPGQSLFSWDVSGSSKALTIDAPNTYVVCAYVQSLSGDQPVVKGTFKLPVRANTATAALQAPATATSGLAVPITLTGTTEVARSAFARVKPAGAGPCGPSFNADAGSGSFAFDLGVAGAFSVPRLTDRLGDPGPYTLCLWIQERSSDAFAEATATAPLNVLPPRPAPSEISMGDTTFPAVRFGSSITRSFTGGTLVSFTMNTPATARFTVQRRTTGRRKRWVPMRGSFTWNATRGYNSFRFSGRIRGRTLKRARYRLVMSTRNAAGSGQVRRRVFRITRR